MTVTLLAALVQARTPQTVVDMVVGGTMATRVVLGLLALFSLASWWLIFAKYRQFREVRRQGDRFLDHMERAQRLEDAYKAVLALPESPYSRVFRQGVNFFSELRPGALRQGAPPSEGLSLAQLDVLRTVMEKEENEEREELAHGLTWLAVIATVSPLLGLLGTVIGIMDAFMEITAAGGSTSIAVVAPGIAEALIATAAGLFVAIPAAIAYNAFVGRLGRVTSELEGFSSEFIGTLAREGRI
jgi:biopolymer transport protein TolQ